MKKSLQYIGIKIRRNKELIYGGTEDGKGN